MIIKLFKPVSTFDVTYLRVSPRAVLFNFDCILEALVSF